MTHADVSACPARSEENGQQAPSVDPPEHSEAVRETGGSDTHQTSHGHWKRDSSAENLSSISSSSSSLSYTASSSASSSTPSYSSSWSSTETVARSASGSHCGGEKMPACTLKLIGSEDTAIVVELEVAEECPMFRRMLASAEDGAALYREGKTRELRFPSIRHRVLQKIVDYLRFRRQWNLEGGHNGAFQVESDIALELMLAANFLGLTDEEEAST
ncbi:putative elongin C [Toxoplasma gondii RUB]|uniref:Elongin-C n=9 Tax=Toxoplasma gondii TaxID=5811 RepID=S7VXY7_TOXGG|nr:hypothetical protein TGGT1_291010 [Toxoplasma gondii GT1]KAF4644543.1 hypothetical protein TGRH88_015370 [Toxoplasma gondii]KFG31011.1 putative elongin C [Toxoplasma gondii p89]KFG41414.1 putative elongin C [Toxoplasma gondii FOU]KFG42271.1 putative elongin C [Toxoplasma gondii GAB2-2007-GAL-DOM2]KFG62828.1 putative elongin C [Toxoplasma gondii RUB]KFH05249.1 putative elongin C [Toxoplasma gondii MAS]PUA90318.1 putative elongin C [Toxoplasma gondii TgCATBr9]RQX73624.1 putative elongin C 